MIRSRVRRPSFDVGTTGGADLVLPTTTSSSSPPTSISPLSRKSRRVRGRRGSQLPFWQQQSPHHHHHHHGKSSSTGLRILRRRPRLVLVAGVLLGALPTVYYLVVVVRHRKQPVSSVGGAAGAGVLLPTAVLPPPPDGLPVITAESVRAPDTVIFSNHHSYTKRTPLPKLDDEQALLDLLAMPDFGGLDIQVYVEDNMSRHIYKHLHDGRGVSADAADGHESPSRPWYDYIYAYDDDYKRNPYRAFDDDNVKPDDHVCRRVSWHDDLRVACNNIHEVDLVGRAAALETQFLGSGSFRQAFLVAKRAKDGDESLQFNAAQAAAREQFVFKQQKMDADDDDESYEYMRVDSYVMDIFTSNSLFLNIYGFCGLAQLIEPMPAGDMEGAATPIQSDREIVVHVKNGEPKNKLSVHQKLTFSLEMAQALAYMHNYPDGVIVHDDVHLGQFLLTDDWKHVKIQDFNRAEILLWDVKNEEYCEYLNGKGHGDWRSPEEYHNWPLTEKIDIFSLGNNLYSTLTGLVPHYEQHSGHDLRILVKEGRLPDIHDRYRQGTFAEQKIVEAIEACWEYDADKRIDASGVVAILQEAVGRESERKTKSKDPKES